MKALPEATTTRIILALLAMVSCADAETFCSELFDDCREKIEFVDGTFTITTRYGDTYEGYSVTAGTGIPFRGIRSDAGESLGQYRFLDDNTLLKDMVVYRLLGSGPFMPKTLPAPKIENIEEQPWPADRAQPPLPRPYP